MTDVVPLPHPAPWMVLGTPAAFMGTGAALHTAVCHAESVGPKTLELLLFTVKLKNLHFHYKIARFFFLKKKKPSY